jgi:hypothetical protein
MTAPDETNNNNATTTENNNTNTIWMAPNDWNNTNWGNSWGDSWGDYWEDEQINNMYFDYGTVETINEEKQEIYYEETKETDTDSFESSELPELIQPETHLELDQIWQNNHIERNFCCYNEFHDYIVGHNLTYNDYFDLSHT